MPGSQDHATHTRAVGDGVTPRQGPGRAPNLPSQQAGGVWEATVTRPLWQLPSQAQPHRRARSHTCAQASE